MATDWVKGEALQLVISLHGFKDGDYLNCVCGAVHRFSHWGGLKRNLICCHGDGPITVEDVIGWTPYRPREDK